MGFAELDPAAGVVNKGTIPHPDYAMPEIFFYESHELVTVPKQFSGTGYNI